MGFVSEAELLAQCRVGNAEAWDELFDRHYAAAGRFIFQLGLELTKQDVEEISQDVFLTVIRNIGTFHGESQFQTWLFRIAANKARDFLDRARAAKRGGGQIPISLQSEDPEAGSCLDPPSSAPSPDLLLLNAEQAVLLHHALDQLNEPCREIIQLRYFGDLSYEELSRSLQLNPKTVSSRLSKCLNRLEDVARRVFSEGKNPVFPSNL